MRRRLIISTAGACALGAALPLLAQAQRTYRIGVLSLSVPREYVPVLSMLSSFGYEEGRNLVIDFKSAEGKTNRLPRLAEELVAAKPDLILALLADEIAAMKQATTTIPIVMVWGSTPVELGLIDSLARPGGNITGTTTNTPEMTAKYYEVLRDAVPGLSRVANLSDPDYPGMETYLKWGRKAAADLGLSLTLLPTRNVRELDLALATIERERPDAVLIGITGVNILHLDRIRAHVSRLRLPAIYSAGSVRRGGLMSYSADFEVMGRRNAKMVDMIFKGAKPSEIPVEQPTRFVLGINLKTAKEMGFSIPQNLLIRADEVIE